MLRRKKGQSAVEYAILLAALAVALIAVARNINLGAQRMGNSAETAMGTAAGHIAGLD